MAATHTALLTRDTSDGDIFEVEYRLTQPARLIEAMAKIVFCRLATSPYFEISQRDTTHTVYDTFYDHNTVGEAAPDIIRHRVVHSGRQQITEIVRKTPISKHQAAFYFDAETGRRAHVSAPLAVSREAHVLDFDPAAHRVVGRRSRRRRSAAFREKHTGVVVVISLDNAEDDPNLRDRPDVAVEIEFTVPARTDTDVAGREKRFSFVSHRAEIICISRIAKMFLLSQTYPIICPSRRPDYNSDLRLRVLIMDPFSSAPGCFETVSRCLATQKIAIDYDGIAHSVDVSASVTVEKLAYTKGESKEVVTEVHGFSFASQAAPPPPINCVARFDVEWAPSSVTPERTPGRRGVSH